MDTRTEAAVDSILRDELIRNERIINHPTFGKVRLRRPTPRIERRIAEVRGAQFHKDLQNPDILSRAQLMDIAVARGMWSEDKEERLTHLSRKTGEIMGALENLGYETIDSLSDEYKQNYDRLSEIFSDHEDDEVIQALDRYFDLAEEVSKFDRKRIYDAATSTEVDDLLDRSDILRVQIDLLRELNKIRKEQGQLQMQQARLFMDALESRADRAEELAQIYYCCTKADTDEPLWESYDAAWDADGEDIEVLVMELYFFTHGITDMQKEVLAKHGFTRGVLANVMNDSSEDSPEHPTPNSDGEQQESEQTSSSESEMSTN